MLLVLKVGCMGFVSHLSLDPPTHHAISTVYPVHSRYHSVYVHKFDHLVLGNIPQGPVHTFAEPCTYVMPLPFPLC